MPKPEPTELSEEDLMRLEIESAWLAFADQQPQTHHELSVLDPDNYALLKACFEVGYTTGVRAGMRKRDDT